MKKLISCLIFLCSFAQAESCYKSEMNLDQLIQCADKGDATAQYDLGVMYYHGVGGVSQDYGKAAQWYSKAAEQGHAGAQNNLGLMYENSAGVPQDYVVSYLWVNLAAIQNYSAALKNRDIILKKLTPEQAANAQQRTADWLAKHAQKK